MHPGVALQSTPVWSMVSVESMSGRLERSSPDKALATFDGAKPSEAAPSVPLAASRPPAPGPPSVSVSMPLDAPEVETFVETEQAPRPNGIVAAATALTRPKPRTRALEDRFRMARGYAEAYRPTNAELLTLS